MARSYIVLQAREGLWTAKYDVMHIRQVCFTICQSIHGKNAEKVHAKLLKEVTSLRGRGKGRSEISFSNSHSSIMFEYFTLSMGYFCKQKKIVKKNICQEFMVHHAFTVQNVTVTGRNLCPLRLLQPISQARVKKITEIIQTPRSIN